MNLQGSKTLLFGLVRNLDLARLLSVSDVGAIEVVFVNLEQVVVVRVPEKMKVPEVGETP